MDEIWEYTLLSEELEEEETGENQDNISLDTEIYEDLFNKNTSSYKCLRQIDISRSSLLCDPLYVLPEIEDPDLNKAVWEVEPPKEYDELGIERYKDLCKTEGIIPYRRVIMSLDKQILNLENYSLSEKAMRIICETLLYNKNIEELILRENMFQPEAVAYLGPVIEKTSSIKLIDLKHCQIGPLGARKLATTNITFAKTLVELNLSFNNLEDKGIEYLAPYLKNNTTIKILNLSHNNLGDTALIALASVFEENYSVHNLDLSWNYFYSPAGMKAFMEALGENMSIRTLNLSWNGIGDKETFRQITFYIKNENAKIQHLDLSNNRITGSFTTLLRSGLKTNNNLVSLNLGYNLFTPQEVYYICGTFFDTKTSPSTLKFIDFGNTWVNKTFINLRKRIRKLHCNVSIGGIFSNYKIIGPNNKEIALKRAKFVAEHQKKKKFRKDIGQFIIALKEEPMRKKLFIEMIQKEKLKLDNDLIEYILEQFTDPQNKRFISLKELKEVYLNMFPDTVPLPIKKSKGKKKK